MKTFDLIFQRTMQAILSAIYIACAVAVVMGHTHQVFTALIVLIMLLTISKEEEKKL